MTNIVRDKARTIVVKMPISFKKIFKSCFNNRLILNPIYFFKNHFIRKENTMKASKLFNWIWSEKQQEEYSFEPVWTPREINDQKYEARQRRERYLAAKYLSNN
ncbi:hypothetical protein [Streptococcus vestibularis]|nr:hypothetical protein [Streptococcus vestibularis]WMU95465.1 hypothetical protein [Streptococcus phage SVep1]